MGNPLARAKIRKRVAVVGAVALALTGVALTRSVGVEAHEVITSYPLTCSMMNVGSVFTTNHSPEAGTTPGGNLVLSVHLTTPATGMAMNVTSVMFDLPKPALTQRITGVTFKSGGNFTGRASVNAATGNMSLTFTGNASSTAITLPDFDIASVTSASATPGARVSWMGPASVMLMNGSSMVDNCTPSGGAAIQFAPTVVLDPGAACGPTTTADPGHGDHGHGGDPGTCSTTTTARPTTARPTTASTARPTTSTSRVTPTTPTTARPTTTTTRVVVPTTPRPPTTVMTPTTMKPPGGLLGWLLQLLCLLFRLC